MIYILNIIARGGASSVDISCNIILGISSGPDALVALILESSFSTPLTSMLRGGRAGPGWPVRVGMFAVSSLVNTDWNCEFSIQALSELPLCSCPSSFRGDIPMLSLRFDFIYFQNFLVSFCFMLSRRMLLTLRSSRCTTDLTDLNLFQSSLDLDFLAL